MTVTHILRIDNNVYGGEIKDGKPHGKGVLKYYQDGKLEGRYIGDFKNGLREGKGKWIHNNFSYEGELKQDRLHGKGKLIHKGVVTAGYWFEGTIECHFDDELLEYN